MSILRPTFSELWYRVADLRPRLRSVAQVRRQSFRGHAAYVVEDPAGNRFFRLHRFAYDLVGRLDGRRTVDQAWRLSMERLGDDALTQGEAVQLLGQLYGANLIQADVSPDAADLFRRYGARRRREITDLLGNLLSLRIPLYDPDRLLDRWVGLCGRVFTRGGLCVLAFLLALGGVCLVSRAPEFAAHVDRVLDPAGLPLFYAGLILLKGLHEAGHAFACKRFARVEGGGGEVHAVGVLLVVLFPLPYVDATSAWGLREPGHRALVGAAGVLVELACAAVAAVVWSITSPATLLNDLAYDFIWIAGISTVLFNGNPLLRYDGYYILSDLLEIPNLAGRSRDYLIYLVKHHVWRVRGLDNPAESAAEARALLIYGLAATAFRAFVCIGILLLVADRFFVLGVLLAATSILAWAVVPAARLAGYLLTSPELERVRPRALATTAAAGALLVGLTGGVPFAERCGIEGIAEARRRVEVRAAEDGFLEEILPSEARVSPAGAPLFVAVNPELAARRAETEAELRGARLEQRRALDAGDAVQVQAFAERIAALETRAVETAASLAALTVRPPEAGTWVIEGRERARGDYLRRGEPVGVLAGLDELVVRAVADQETAARIIEAAGLASARLRPRGRPDQDGSGRIERILPAGSKQLDSAALGALAGGAVRTAADDASGTEAAERQFTLVLVPAAELAGALRPGQRVLVRVDLPPRPLLAQWVQAIRRLLQRRFKI